MNVEDALQMCGAASVDFTGGEWCYAANVLAEEVERLRAQVYAANSVTAALDAGRRSEQDSDGSPRSVGERQGRQPAADTKELGRLHALLQEAREVIGCLIECPNQDAPMHSAGGCSYCSAWQVEQAVAWVRDSYPAEERP